MSSTDKYLLNKWSRIVRIRDEHVCRMCLETVPSRRQMHAHHIDMQVKYPEKALDLDNGICLCARCHLQIVHSTRTHEKTFRVIFKRHVRRKKNRQFNAKWQYKLDV